MVNLIKKFEFEPNFIIAEIKIEPEPCDFAFRFEVFMVLQKV